MTDRKHYPPGHVVHMTLDHAGQTSASVARCDCGWEHRVPWHPGTYDDQDQAVEAHWAEVEKKLVLV